MAGLWQVVQPTEANKRALAAAAEVNNQYYAPSFGAVGLGSTIQLAIDQAFNDGGGNVYIPAGTWDLNGTGLVMRSGVRVQGVPAQVQARANCPDLGWDLIGGTIIRGTGTENAFTDNTAAGGTVTFDLGTDRVQRTAHGYQNGGRVYLSTDGTLPTPLLEDTTYWVVGVTVNDFQLSLTEGGAAIDLGGSPSGTHIVHNNLPTQYAIIESLGIHDVSRCFSFGAEYANGLSFSVVRDVIVTETDDWLASFTNGQHIEVRSVHGFNARRGILYRAHDDSCAPGISSNYDCFIYLKTLQSGNPDYPRRYGYAAINTLDGGLQLDGIRWYSCQCNIYGPTNNGSSFDVADGDVNTSTDRISETDHGLNEGDPVRFHGDDLPDPLVSDQPYFALNVTANDFQLSTQEDLSDTVSLTDLGSGTRTCRYYPGDTVGFFIKGEANGAVTTTPGAWLCYTDGVQNNFYRLDKTTNGQFHIGHFGATLHGERHVALIDSDYNSFFCTNVNMDLWQDNDSSPNFLYGIGDVRTDSLRLPYGTYLDAATGIDHIFAISNNYNMQGNSAKQAFEPQVLANNTWNNQSVAPCYHNDQSTSFAQGNNRMGTTRYNGQSVTVTHTLPAVSTVALGCMAIIFNDDDASDVTVDVTGADTINGATQTLTVNPDEVCFMIADNRAGRTNWIGFVHAVTES
jgi:hypothetical protein